MLQNKDDAPKEDDAQKKDDASNHLYGWFYNNQVSGIRLNFIIPFNKINSTRY